MEAMPVHSQYTSTVRVKVSDPTTLLAVIWYTPLSSRVTSAIVKLVAVTVNLMSVTSTLFLVKVMFGGGFVLRLKWKVNCSPSVGVAVSMVGVKRGGTGSREMGDRVITISVARSTNCTLQIKLTRS